MKNVYQVFDEYFPSLLEALNKLNYLSCSTISTDLIKFSEMIEFDDGVFIGEIFESTFNQVFAEMTRYEVADNDVQSLKNQFIGSITTISKCYKDTDKNDLFNALKNMRLNATKFQFHIRRQCKPKPQMPTFPIPLQLR